MPPDMPVIWMSPTVKGYRLTGVADVVTNRTAGWTALISEDTKQHMQRNAKMAR